MSVDLLSARHSLTDLSHPRIGVVGTVILRAMNHARIATEALRFRMGTFSAQADSPPGLNADEAGELLVACGDPGVDHALRMVGETWCEAGLTPDHIDHPWTAERPPDCDRSVDRTCWMPSTNSSPGSPAAASAADPPVTPPAATRRIRACTVAPTGPEPLSHPGNRMPVDPNARVPELHHGQAAETHPRRNGLRPRGR